jgi:hypothetical protein
MCYIPGYLLSNNRWPGAKVMKNLEYTAFYKFLVSLGLALIVFSLVAPWLLFREPFNIGVKTSELSQLTPRAKRVIEDRQRFAEVSSRAAPWGSAAIFVLGLGLASFGLLRWNSRQKVLDTTEDVTLEKLQLEVRQLSPNEAEHRVEIEARETVDAETPSLAGTAPTARERYVATLARLFALERLAMEKLGSAFHDTHVIEDRIQIGEEQLDARLRSKGQEKDYLLEIKYFRGRAAALSQKAIEQVARATIAYSDHTKQDVAALLLVIIGRELGSSAGGEQNGAGIVQAVQRSLNEIKSRLSVDVRPLVLSEGQFEEMDANELKRRFFSAS